jgi:hypothetical protein
MNLLLPRFKSQKPLAASVDYLHLNYYYNNPHIVCQSSSVTYAWNQEPSLFNPVTDFTAPAVIFGHFHSSKKMVVPRTLFSPLYPG